jgi:hypothetical protein
MPIQGEEVIVNVLPQCQFNCEEKAVYDTRTKIGPWAFVCEAHWKEHGVGRLGTGFGQRLVVWPAPVLLNCGSCPFCGEDAILTLKDTDEYDAIAAWSAMPAANRPYIQDAFPRFSPGVRETILTGTHEKCWDEMFGGDEE